MYFSSVRTHVRRVFPRVALILALSLLVGCGGASVERSYDPLGMFSGQQAPQSEAAWNLLLSGKTVESLEAFRDAGERGPLEARSSAWVGLGESQWMLGRFNEAADAYIRAIEMDPDNVWTRLAWLRLQGLTARADGMEERLDRALDAYQKHQGNTSAWTRYQANALDLFLKRKRWSRSDDAKPFDSSFAGVPPAWKVSGPSSLHAYLDFDKTTPMEQGKFLEESYDLLGFRRLTKTVQTKSDTLELQNVWSGVYVAESWLSLDEEGTFDLAIYAQGILEVYIDGERVARRDDRSEFLPTRFLVEGVELSGGSHRVLVKVGVSRGYKDEFGVTFLPRKRSQKMAFSSLPGSFAGSLQEEGVQKSWLGSVQKDSPGLEPDYLPMLAVVANYVYDEKASKASIDMLRNAYPDYLGTYFLEADFAQGQWSSPGEIRARERLVALRSALDKEPLAANARLKLAGTFRAQQLKDTTEEMVDGLLRDIPDQSVAWLEASRYYAWRGFQARAEEALEKARQLDPSRCEMAQSLYAAWRQRDYTPAATPEEWKQCEIIDWNHAQNVLLLRGDHSRTLFHLQRDAGRYPARPEMWAAYARGVWDFEGADKALLILEEALTLHPENISLLLMKFDVVLDLGDEKECWSILRKVLSIDPGAVPARKRWASLKSELPLQDLMVDGIRAIDEYEAEETKHNSSALYVLDYMARRYFEDGSHAEVIHLVIKVLSKEGIDKHGEVSFPRGSTPLFVRAVKHKNRQIVEPSRQKGKDTISMESLEPGDYIEYAYLVFHGHNPTRKEAALGANFFFAMDDISSARSEFVVEVPSSWNPDFVRKNAPPKAEISSGEGWKRFRFLRKGSTQPRREPNSVPNGEFLPHVQMIHAYTWEDAHKAYQNLLSTAQAISPALEKRSHDVVQAAGAGTRDQKVRALYDFVAQHIKKPSFRDFSTDASHVEQSGSGNPMVLLQALLKVQDIPSEMVLVRSHQQNPEENAIPSFGAYDFVVLKVGEGPKTLWLNPANRYAPYNFMPAVVQNAPAIVIEPGAPFQKIKTPEFDAEEDRRDIDFKLSLSIEGELTGTIVETLRGYNGMKRRQAYESMGSDEKIRKYAERQLNYNISGAELLSVEVGHQDDPDAPLTLTMTFRRPGYARTLPDGSMLIEDRYNLPDLTRRHARLPERTIPMLLGSRSQSVTYSLEVPQGMQVNLEGEDLLTHSTDFGFYERVVEEKKNLLKMSHSLLMKTQRIPVDRYEEFSEWTGDVDRGSYVRILVK